MHMPPKKMTYFNIREIIILFTTALNHNLVTCKIHERNQNILKYQSPVSACCFSVQLFKRKKKGGCTSPVKIRVVYLLGGKYRKGANLEGYKNGGPWGACAMASTPML